MDPGFRRDDRLPMVAGMDARRGPFEEFAIATAVLTRLPVGIAVPGESGAIAAAGWAFPLVGAGIGGLAALVFLLTQLIGCGSAVAAWLPPVSGTPLSGGFPEGGPGGHPAR